MKYISLSFDYNHVSIRPTQISRALFIYIFFILKRFLSINLKVKILHFNHFSVQKLSLPNFNLKTEHIFASLAVGVPWNTF